MLPSATFPTSAALAQLNEQYRTYSPVERIQQLYTQFRPSEVLLTSSFGTQSALLLYWISNLQPQQPIHFLDTGYHFEETLAFKTTLTQAFDLQVVDLRPDELAQLQTHTQELWLHKPTKCCYINKVQPLEHIKWRYTIWMSGLMHYQTPHRKGLDIFEQQDNIIKFYPLMDMKEQDFEQAYADAALPRHPLQALGYHSIGCWHCTQRGKGRSGRWAGQDKTECGLHT